MKEFGVKTKTTTLVCFLTSYQETEAGWLPGYIGTWEMVLSLCLLLESDGDENWAPEEASKTAWDAQ